jgi:hypothetical protein
MLTYEDLAILSKLTKNYLELVINSHLSMFMSKHQDLKSEQ